MSLPVEKILAEAQLTVKEVSLSRNLDIFGCCLLLDGEVDVYDAALLKRGIYACGFSLTNALIREQPHIQDTPQLLAFRWRG